MIVCVLYGGLSCERKVSINSGLGILNSLKKKYKTYGYDFNGDYESLYENIKKADIVFNALHGGDGENGIIQAYLENKNIIFTGSGSKPSRLAMDKHKSKIVCLKNKILTPDWLVYNNNISKVEKFNNKSIVVKPTNEGSSMGLSIIDEYHGNNDSKIKNLNSAILLAKEVSDSILIEEYIEGRELTVGVLGEKILPTIEIKPNNNIYDYDSKYKKGKTEYIVPAPLNQEVNKMLKHTSKKIFKLFKCEQYARIDFRLSLNNKLYFLEMNTLPGFTDTSLFPKAAEAANIDYDCLVENIINDCKK